MDVMVGLHQGLVRDPLLLTGVSSEARCCLPPEFLYANDLVLMAPTMEQLGRVMAE